jgi:hypothetical protein
MHKDQTRVAKVLVPAILGVVGSEEAQAVTDATMLNRMLIQGPDPLFIMQSSPDYFAELCRRLDLTVEEGTEAIESAHNQGPGVFLREDLGLTEANWASSLENETRMKEALWLILASISDCTEGGYPAEVSMTERIRRAMAPAVELAEIINGNRAAKQGLVLHAIAELTKRMRVAEFTKDPDFGKPMGDDDFAFYVGYKLGHSCVAVQQGPLTFFGTIPGTTLEAEGVDLATAAAARDNCEAKILAPAYSVLEAGAPSAGTFGLIAPRR